MAGFLGFIGLVLLVWGLVQVFQKAKRKKGLIKLGIGFVLFIIVGIVAPPAEDNQAEADKADTEVKAESEQEDEDTKLKKSRRTG
ncbi:hypothetical protein CV093_06110 [Oceanobacillus sp. 143]|nr:hypothetical protein CV093_06110 [Oceanobacillus sp. 143]